MDELPNDIDELKKCVLAGQVVRDLDREKMEEMRRENLRLRSALINLYQDDHVSGEWDCPNDAGECNCGLVERNADIDFYLDPTNPREMYLRERKQDAALLKLDLLYEHADEIAMFQPEDEVFYDLAMQTLSRQFAILLEAQPWLVVQEEQDGHV